MISPQSLHVWGSISFVAGLAVAGEVLIAAGMRQIGDLDVIRARSGIGGAIKAVLSNSKFVLGAFGMAFNFFAMLFTLRERVDDRRWLATGFVALGVVLLAR